jgi:competence protein ComEA
VYNVCAARCFTMTTRAPHLSFTVVGLGVLVLVGGVLWFGLGATEPAPPRPTVDTVARVDGSPITVHVSGAVLDAGVVVVPLDSRVMDVVLAAGGATLAADLTRINLAATVRDGERIIVPFKGETRASPAGDEGVDLNAADASGLEALPGVGPVLAARIVAYREENGPFSAVEDLLDVPGIGEAKLAAMRDAISPP